MKCNYIVLTCVCVCVYGICYIGTTGLHCLCVRTPTLNDTQFYTRYVTKIQFKPLLSCCGCAQQCAVGQRRIILLLFAALRQPYVSLQEQVFCFSVSGGVGGGRREHQNFDSVCKSAESSKDIWFREWLPA